MRLFVYQLDTVYSEDFTGWESDPTSVEYQTAVRNLKNIWGKFLAPLEGNELLSVTFTSGSKAKLKVGSAVGYTAAYIQEILPDVVLQNNGYDVEVALVTVLEPVTGRHVTFSPGRDAVGQTRT